MRPAGSEAEPSVGGVVKQAREWREKRRAEQKDNRQITRELRRGEQSRRTIGRSRGSCGK
eukprot:scaffold38102_cov34-Phaeocystis_antarctica.AAC.1